VQSQRKRLNLTILVEDVDFDVTGGRMRVKGKNQTENQFVKIGQYHTVELEDNRAVTIHKQRWDAIYLDRIKTATDPRNAAEAACVVLQEGLAHIVLITSHALIPNKIEVNIPRKRMGSSTRHDKALLKFFNNVMEGVLRHIKFQVTKAVVIAGPGFIKESFLQFMMAEAVKTNNRTLMDNKDKFILAPAATGHMQSVREILADPKMQEALGETKAAGEVKALDRFYAMLSDDEDRAFYGFQQVSFANEQNAIDTLLVTDELFRSADLKQRIQYVDLVESAKANGAEVRIFSTLHSSGQQLSNLSGVAAILRFPLVVPDELLEHGDIDSDSEAEDGAGPHASAASNSRMLAQPSLDDHKHNAQ
jgi:protein pelota